RAGITDGCGRRETAHFARFFTRPRSRYWRRKSKGGSVSRPTSVLKLHLAKRGYVFGIPASILGLVIVITILITIAMSRFAAGVGGQELEYAQSAQQNPGVLFSLPGFLVYLGGQAVSTTFPYEIG